MFDSLSDAGLIDGMSAAGRVESAAIARRLALVGELDARRAVEWVERRLWVTDPFEAVAAEVSAALSISRRRAGSQISQARALRDRLPAVAAVFASGGVDYRVVREIIDRTDTVDDAVIARVDAVLARHCHKWTRLSDKQLRDRIDHWVAKHDPAGQRIPPTIDEGRYVEIAPTTPGMAGIWASLHAADAAALDQRLNAIAATVCDNDPRTREQRRADACGAIGRGEDVLACQCGSQDCPAAAQRAAAATVVVHVLAEQATLDATSNTPGYLPGFGILPAETVREVAQTAKRKPLDIPADAAEPGYRPSVAVTEFVRWRDLTCRFPGCDKPAEACDIDHTTPHPAGPTHPSNLKLYCRAHHLLKTFYTGPGGWTDQQLPDGTIIITAPTGHTYITEPHGATMFPALAHPTGDLNLPTADEPSPDRGRMMPTRKHTREHDRQTRITTERHQRTELITEQQRQHQAWLAANHQPPPF